VSDDDDWRWWLVEHAEPDDDRAGGVHVGWPAGAAGERGRVAAGDRRRVVAVPIVTQVTRITVQL
jgi:hypothetical protein